MLKLNALVLAALSIVTVTSVQAADSTSSLTRADVIAEYQRARAAGELTNESLDHSGFRQLATNVASTLTRADVLAELARAQKAGEYHFGEGSAAVPVTTTVSTLTRMDVIDEYLRARSLGQVAEANNEFGPIQRRRTVQ